jgi:hypothetical protein
MLFVSQIPPRGGGGRGARVHVACRPQFAGNQLRTLGRALRSTDARTPITGEARYALETRVTYRGA